MLMSKPVIMLLGLLTVSSCAETQAAVDTSARNAAKATVEKVVVTELPGVPASQVTPYSDCIIDSASAKEIFKLSSAAVLGVQPDTVSLVTDIVERPTTLKCIASAALASVQL